jgi:putative tricarboxylic transport membrane protein
MADAVEKPTAPPVRHGWVRSPQDLIGGLAIVALALFAIWACRDLTGMRGNAFGPGTAPRLFSGILAVVGGLLALRGFLADGPGLARYALRGPLFVIAAILAFAGTIRPLGLVISSFATFLIAAAATPDVRWGETVIVGAALTAFCAVLFPYVLNLPMPLWPTGIRF